MKLDAYTDFVGRACIAGCLLVLLVVSPGCGGDDSLDAQKGGSGRKNSGGADNAQRGEPQSGAPQGDSPAPNKDQSFRGPPATGPLAGPAGTPRPADDAPVVPVKIGDYLDAYKADAEATFKQYGDKWVEVTGKVVDFETNPNDYGNGSHSVAVVLAAENDRFKFKKCLVRDTAPWKKTSAGSVVTIRAVVAKQGPFLGFFDHGTIITEPYQPTPELTAVEFAQAFLKDPKGTKEEYGYGKSIVLSGEVVEREEGGGELLLKGEGDVSVGVLASWDFQFRPVQPGDRIEVIGETFVDADAEVENPKIGVRSAYRIDFLDNP